MVDTDYDVRCFNTEISVFLENLATEPDTTKKYMQAMSAPSKIDTKSKTGPYPVFVNAKLTKYQCNVIRNYARVEDCFFYTQKAKR